jgi:hypothetical protein
MLAYSAPKKQNMTKNMQNRLENKQNNIQENMQNRAEKCKICRKYATNLKMQNMQKKYAE